MISPAALLLEILRLKKLPQSSKDFIKNTKTTTNGYE